MFDVTDDQMVFLTKGDTCAFTLVLLVGSNMCPYRYRIKPNEQLLLGISEPNSSFEDAILKKVYTYDDINENGDVIITLNHNDTKCLKEQTYFYSIKLLTEDGDVETVVDKKRFHII